jgi:hypothetical protein
LLASGVFWCQLWWNIPLRMTLELEKSSSHYSSKHSSILFSRPWHQNRIWITCWWQTQHLHLLLIGRNWSTVPWYLFMLSILGGWEACQFTKLAPIKFQIRIGKCSISWANSYPQNANTRTSKRDILIETCISIPKGDKNIAFPAYGTVYFV